MAPSPAVHRMWLCPPTPRSISPRALSPLPTPSTISPSHPPSPLVGPTPSAQAMLPLQASSPSPPTRVALTPSPSTWGPVSLLPAPPQSRRPTPPRPISTPLPLTIRYGQPTSPWPQVVPSLATPPASLSRVIGPTLWAPSPQVTPPLPSPARLQVPSPVPPPSTIWNNLLPVRP